MKTPNSEEKHYSNTFIVTSFLTHVLHTLDMYTDLALAYEMYQLREQEFGAYGKMVNDYHWVFIWIIISTFGPYIIQYSSRMNSNYIKGIYREDKWKGYGMLKKCQLALSFTFLGLLFTVFFDIIQKVEATFLLLMLILTSLICKPKLAKGVRKSLERFN